jgi:uncharacterized membrane protein
MPNHEPAPLAGDERIDLTHVTRNEFISAMVHLYRGELAEASAWRTRIDTTSNWAVVLSVTALSFVFGGTNGERHVLIPIVVLFSTFLLMMEARRYRFYDIWRTRARTIEINFYRPMLDGSQPAQPDWASALAHDLAWPHYHMPWWEAAGRRLRRNYQWIYAILLASWLVVLMAYPTPSTTVSEVVARAAIGPLPGSLVMVSMVIFYSVLIALGVYSYWASRHAHRLPAGHPDRMREEPHT